MRIAVLTTCHNRREQTLACLHALHQNDLATGHSLHPILVDDGSGDATAAAVRSAFPSVQVVQADGTLFWNRSMHLAFEIAVRVGFDAYLWLNDDTVAYPDTIGRLVETMRRQSSSGPCIVVGSTRDPATGMRTYGGERRAGWRRMRFVPVQPESEPVLCDTFNGNCVLVPRAVVARIGLIDPSFAHAMGDTDYGLRATAAGVPIWVMPGYAGDCAHDHPVSGTYRDRSLPFAERWHRIMQPKGLPPRSWWHITRRHAGIAWPLFWAWPYFRLLLEAPLSLLPHRGRRA
jgi:GT2 family glycosyltransferase